MNIAQRVGVHLSIAACAAGVMWIALRSTGSPSDSLAFGRQGLEAWDRSCPGPSTNGLCLAEKPRPVTRVPGALPLRCGPDALALPAARTRDVAELAMALAAFDSGAVLPARARLARIDADLETQLFARRIPTTDAITVECKSSFTAWWTETQRLAGDLKDRYTALVAGLDREVSVAAALRVAQVDRFVTDLLLSSPIPEPLRVGTYADDKVDAYCDALTQTAEPIERRTVAELTACVELASTVTASLVDPAHLEAVLRWSDACAADLAQLQPDKFHTVDEALGARHATARLWVRLRNFDAAAGLLESGVSERDYDRLNTLGVIHRHRGDFATAERTYREAIALDDTRPEAYFNLGLLREAASAKLEPSASVAVYTEAMTFFEQSRARASGPLKAQAQERYALTAKVIAAVQKFVTAQAH